MKALRGLVVAGVAMAVAGAAQATIVTYNFEGVSSGGHSVPGATSTFSGSFSYDTDAPQFDGYDGYADYAGMVSLSFRSGTAFTSGVVTSGGISRIQVGNNSSVFNPYFPPDVVTFTIQRSGYGDGIQSTNGFGSAVVRFVDDSAQAFTSTGLPRSISISQFNSTYFQIYTAGGYSYAGNFTSLSLAPAPEPVSWAMMMAGFGLVGGVLRSRRAPARHFG